MKMISGIAYRATLFQRETTGSLVLIIKLLAAVVAALPFDGDRLACQSILQLLLAL
jgi:hypothetical protein